jgi:hypothetical protein
MYVSPHLTARYCESERTASLVSLGYFGLELEWWSEPGLFSSSSDTIAFANPDHNLPCNLLECLCPSGMPLLCIVQKRFKQFNSIPQAQVWTRRGVVWTRSKKDGSKFTPIFLGSADTVLNRERKTKRWVYDKYSDTVSRTPVCFQNSRPSPHVGRPCTIHHVRFLSLIWRSLG